MLSFQYGSLEMLAVIRRKKCRKPLQEASMIYHPYLSWVIGFRIPIQEV